MSYDDEWPQTCSIIKFHKAVKRRHENEWVLKGQASWAKRQKENKVNDDEKSEINRKHNYKRSDEKWRWMKVKKPRCGWSKPKREGRQWRKPDKKKNYSWRIEELIIKHAKRKKGRET